MLNAMTLIENSMCPCLESGIFLKFFYLRASESVRYSYRNSDALHESKWWQIETMRFVTKMVTFASTENYLI